MKNLKHTPAPWLVRKWKREHITEKGETQTRWMYQVSSSTGEAIEASSKNEANVRLIAAAPEMKFLLEECAIMLRVSAAQLSDVYVSNTNKATGEKLEIRGLKTTLLNLEKQISTLIYKATSGDE